MSVNLESKLWCLWSKKHTILTQDTIQSVFCSFFGRIWDFNIYFRNLLTFSTQSIWVKEFIYYCCGEKCMSQFFFGFLKKCTRVKTAPLKSAGTTDPVYGKSLDELQLDRPRNGLFLSALKHLSTSQWRKPSSQKNYTFQKTGKKFKREVLKY